MGDIESHTISHKKRTKLTSWVSSSFESFPKAENVEQTTKKRKISRSSSVEFFRPKKTDESETWLQRYVPATLEELAVHKKKVQEVDSWLSSNTAIKKGGRGGAPILLVTGPPGCGKTTTLMLIAKKHGVHLEEWLNPLTVSYSVVRQAGLNYESEVTKFEEFLFRSGKYCSVLSDDNNAGEVNSPKMVLLEELPNFIFQDPSTLVDIISKYKSTQRWPLVLVVTDGPSTDPLKRRLREVSNKFTTISFNPISPTLMSKALNRIATAERRYLSKEELAMISSVGDIRTAINALQFSSQFENLKEISNKPKSHRSAKVDFSCIGAKDTTLILFRALGKIFYCKREKRKDNNASSFQRRETYRDTLIKQPEDILEQCCLSGCAFGLFLHQNYLNFYDSNPIGDISAASDCLSVADTMNSPLTTSDPSSGAMTQLDLYEGIVSSRGLLFHNSTRSTEDLCSRAVGSWRPMYKPTWYEVRRVAMENRITSHRLFWKQEDALPCLVNLASKFDHPQRNFLREVVAIPKWRVFRSFGEKLTDQAIENDESETIESPTADVETKMEVDDDDVIIEEFCD